jgi:hypothetical protein
MHPWHLGSLIRPSVLIRRVRANSEHAPKHASADNKVPVEGIPRRRACRTLDLSAQYPSFGLASFQVAVLDNYGRSSLRLEYRMFRLSSGPIQASRIPNGTVSQHLTIVRNLSPSRASLRNSARLTEITCRATTGTSISRDLTTFSEHCNTIHHERSVKTRNLIAAVSYIQSPATGIANWRPPYSYPRIPQSSPSTPPNCRLPPRCSDPASPSRRR